jgi:hypothetical protein
VTLEGAGGLATKRGSSLSLSLSVLGGTRASGPKIFLPRPSASPAPTFRTPTARIRKTGGSCNFGFDPNSSYSFSRREKKRSHD